MLLKQNPSLCSSTHPLERFYKEIHIHYTFTKQISSMWCIISPYHLRVVAALLHLPGLSVPAAPPAYWCWWFPLELVVLHSDQPVKDRKIIHSSTFQHTSCSRNWTVCTHQRWHMSEMHLSGSDLLLWRWHGTHVQRFWTHRTWPQNSRQCHWTMFRPSNTIILLLQYSGSKTKETVRRIYNK